MLLEHENVLWAGVNKVKQTQRPVKPTETSELMQSGRYFTKRDEIFKLRNNSQSRFGMIQESPLRRTVISLVPILLGDFGELCRTALELIHAGVVSEHCGTDCDRVAT